MARAVVCQPYENIFIEGSKEHPKPGGIFGTAKTMEAAKRNGEEMLNEGMDYFTIRQQWHCRKR